MSSQATVSSSPEAPLSKRAQARLQASSMPDYWRINVACNTPERAFHPETNPNGYIGLCVAENKTAFDLTEGRLSDVSTSEEYMYYSSLQGVDSARDAVSTFLSSLLFHRPVHPDKLHFLASCGTVIEQVVTALCDEGDGVIMTTPIYSGLLADVESRADCASVLADLTSENGFRITRDLLDDAFDIAESQQVTVKVLLLVNPGNPTGLVLSKDELEVIGEFLTMHPGVHLVMDEVYALSVHSPSTETPFVSIGALFNPSAVADDADAAKAAGASARDAESAEWAEIVEDLTPLFQPLTARLHWCYALSKDFLAGMYRAGILYTENTDLIRALSSVAMWHAVGGPVQQIMAQSLGDPAWVRRFRSAANARLHETFAAVRDAFQGTKVRVLDSPAGLYAYVSFAELLGALPGEEDHVRDFALWKRLVEQCAVNMTPGGSACHAQEPGWYRLCFAAVPRETLAVGLARLRAEALALEAALAKSA